MKTAIIKKSDIIHIKRQKLSNVLLDAIGKTLSFSNFISFKIFENQLVGLFNWMHKKSTQFYLKN